MFCKNCRVKLLADSAAGLRPAQAVAQTVVDLKHYCRPGLKTCSLETAGELERAEVATAVEPPQRQCNGLGGEGPSLSETIGSSDKNSLTRIRREAAPQPPQRRHG